MIILGNLFVVKPCSNPIEKRVSPFLTTYKSGRQSFSCVGADLVELLGVDLVLLAACSDFVEISTTGAGDEGYDLQATSAMDMNKLAISFNVADAVLKKSRMISPFSIHSAGARILPVQVCW